MVYPFLWLVMGCKLTNSQEHARTKIMLIELLAQLGPPPFFSRSAVHGCPARKSWNGTTNSNWTMMTTGSVHHAEMLCCWTSAVRHSCWKHRIDHQRCLTPRCMLDFLAGVRLLNCWSLNEDFWPVLPSPSLLQQRANPSALDQDQKHRRINTQYTCMWYV